MNNKDVATCIGVDLHRWTHVKRILYSAPPKPSARQLLTERRAAKGHYLTSRYALYEQATLSIPERAALVNE